MGAIGLVKEALAVAFGFKEAGLADGLMQPSKSIVVNAIGSAVVVRTVW